MRLNREMVPRRSLRAVIADGDPAERDVLRSMLLETDASRAMEIVEQCGTAQEAIAAIQEHRPDVVFVDVELRGGDAFSVIDAVDGDDMPIFVFVTANDHYALQAFDVAAADYVLKPFDGARLERALRRVAGQVEKGSDEFETRVISLLKGFRDRKRYACRLAVDSGNHLTFVPTAEVDWVEAKGKHSLLHTGTASHVMREGLSNVAARLDPADFIRVHRSYIVRIERIKHIHRWFRGGYCLVLDDGTKLNSGATFKKSIEQALLGAQKPLS